MICTYFNLLLRAWTNNARQFIMLFSHVWKYTGTTGSRQTCHLEPYSDPWWGGYSKSELGRCEDCGAGASKLRVKLDNDHDDNSDTTSRNWDWQRRRGWSPEDIS